MCQILLVAFWCQVPKMEAKACNLRPLGGGNFTIKQSAQIVHCIQDYILIYYIQCESFLLFSVGVQEK